MVTTGLVSLNVHEALSFDGTPICLHPDLFSTVGDLPSYHSGTTTVVAANRGKDSRLPLNSTMSSEDTAGRIYSTLSDNNKGLQVGDMLEIRVWDPLPKTHAASSLNASSIMRQRAAPQMNHSNSSASQPTSVASSSSSVMETPSALNANNSMQYSDGSVTDITEVEDAGKQEIVDLSTASSGDPSQSVVSLTPISSPIPPSKTMGTAGEGAATELPPVAPRGRANTAENARNIVAKPPLQRRTTATQQPRSSKPRHVRDLSDMTADTAYGTAGTTTLDSSQQLVDFHLPMGVSAGDDDEDLWLTLSHTHRLRLSFVMLVTEKTLTSLKGSARAQVSILRQVADLYHLTSYDMVSIHKVSKDEEEAALEAVSADFLLVTIKDQFISRGDMHFFQKSLFGSWVYEGQRLYDATRGLQANAREIRHREQQALSGIVTDKTLITFRSRSSRIIWLVQISSEMWDFSSPYERGQEEGLCEIYFDKWIAFIHKLFAKWKELEATHSLTVVFFSRSFLIPNPTAHGAEGQQDVYGRRYEDHFRIVLENETGPDWDSLVVKIKEAFVIYPTEVGWTLSTGDNARRPSTASQGNVLEAINVTLNLLQFHYLDRDLNRTGNSVVVVSAGNGVFEVDKGLAGISYQVSYDWNQSKKCTPLRSIYFNLTRVHVTPSE
jgi:Vacuolar membrane-associated protein Iml1